MKKTIGITLTWLVLALAGGIGWHHRDLSQTRLLREAEDIVFTDVDSAARLLALEDTARLTDGSQMFYDLMRGLVYEEQWYMRYADTASCLSASETKWAFWREVAYQKADDQTFPDDSTLLRVYRYYERASLGGTSEDKEALRRFGRICFVLSRHFNDRDSLLQPCKLFNLAIHCAEAADDQSLAYRAWNRWGNHLDYTGAYNIKVSLCMRHALECFRRLPDNPSWLLRALNDYGCSALVRSPFDLHHFPLLVRAASLVANHRQGDLDADVCDSVYQCLDSLWALPPLDMQYVRKNTSGGKMPKYENFYSRWKEVGVSVDVYDEAFRSRTDFLAKYGYSPYLSEVERTEQSIAVERSTYLAPGYVQKAAMLQWRLMTTVITVLVLAVLVLLLVFWGWRNAVRRRHEAEQASHWREAEQLAERLRQKDTLIEMLRGHILDKSEILEMLAPTEGKRTIINARNWREIEATLETVDGGFVSRLRAQFPQFSEEDIRLCMLTRLRLSNTALSAIYAISVSAVQHRKQKLKKDGFGVGDPSVTLDQIIANY